MQKQIDFSSLTLGVCYYPEHWDPALWQSDLERMEQLGISIIRIGEFAWNIMEPKEGEFHFEFFHTFLDYVNQIGIKVMLGTPTATPPAWLTEKYPDVLNAAVDGTKYRHGMRRHYNYTSPIYHELTRKIVTEMALQFGHHPAICGWQIDNEFNCEIQEFYADSDHAAFRSYIKDKYKTIAALNQAWGTNFWSQTYTSWDQVYLRRPTVSNSGNPHMMLDSQRFISHSCIQYCKLQSDILRRHISPEQFITTNGCFPTIDYTEMVDQCLDFICYDTYPDFGYSPDNTDPLRDRKWSWNLTGVRAICPTFGIIEQQAGAGGWVDNNRMRLPMPRPGQMRLWAYQSMVHGADFVSFFRWRTCSFGTEIYWHGLYNYDNRNNRRVDELKMIAQEFQQLKDVAKSNYHAEVAVVCDYDNEWDGQMDLWHGPLRKKSERNFFAAATYSHTPIDKVILNSKTSAAQLHSYKALIYPHPTIIDEERVALLSNYVASGGQLLIGARAGYKDQNGQCPMRPMPGLLAALCGAEVIDYSLVSDTHRNIAIHMDADFSLVDFMDILKPVSDHAEVIGRYSDDYCKDMPACLRHNYQEGVVYTYGSGFSQEAAAEWLEMLSVKTPYAHVLSLPECCEIAIRQHENEQYLFVLNYVKERAEITLHKPLYDVLAEKQVSGKIEINGYDVMVWKGDLAAFS